MAIVGRIFFKRADDKSKPGTIPVGSRLDLAIAFN